MEKGQYIVYLSMLITIWIVLIVEFYLLTKWREKRDNEQNNNNKKNKNL